MQFLLKVYSLKVLSHCAGIARLEQLGRISSTRLLLVALPLTEDLGQTCCFNAPKTWFTQALNVP